MQKIADEELEKEMEQKPAQELQELLYLKQFYLSLEKNFLFLNQMIIMFWKNILKMNFSKEWKKYYVDNPETEKSHKFLEK